MSFSETLSLSVSSILWCLHNIDPWLLQALYAKLFLAGEKIWHETRATSNLRPEAVVWQMVRFFASQEDGLVGQMRWDFCGPFISSCKRLLSVLLTAEPRVRRLVTVCLCVSNIYI